jgi:hypothetical protein
MSFEVVIFIFGAILFFVALIGGGIKIKEIEIQKIQK